MSFGSTVALASTVIVTLPFAWKWNGGGESIRIYVSHTANTTQRATEQRHKIENVPKPVLIIVFGKIFHRKWFVVKQLSSSIFVRIERWWQKQRAGKHTQKKSTLPVRTGMRNLPKFKRPYFSQSQIIRCVRWGNECNYMDCYELPSQLIYTPPVNASVCVWANEICGSVKSEKYTARNPIAHSISSSIQWLFSIFTLQSNCARRPRIFKSCKNEDEWRQWTQRSSTRKSRKPENGYWLLQQQQQQQQKHWQLNRKWENEWEESDWERESESEEWT